MVDDHVVQKFSRNLTPGDPSGAFPTSVVKCDLGKVLLPLQVSKGMSRIAKLANVLALMKV